MSWGIKIAGKPANVLAEVNLQEFMPQGLKDAVKTIADQVGPDDYTNGVFVESFGHIGGGSSNAKFTCEPIHLAPCVGQYQPEPQAETGALTEPPKDSAPPAA